MIQTGKGILAKEELEKEIALPFLDIVKYPDKGLTTPCEKVTDFNDDLKALAYRMQNTLPTLPGKAAGLAANQIGSNLRIFVTPEDIYINPVITHVANGKQYETEGCYSLEEGKFVRTERDQSIYMEWKNLFGHTQMQKFHGKRAQVMQHEIDHLNGIMCDSKALKE